MTWPIHPAAEWFPTLPDDELEQLATDIAANGLNNPISLWEDPEQGTVLLDGRNRLFACELAGVEPRTQIYRGSDPVGFVISQNLLRRHLAPGQLVAIAERRMEYHSALAVNRRRLGRPRTEQEVQMDPSGGQATDTAAAEVGTAGSQLRHYLTIKKRRPDLAEKVGAGELTLNGAYEQVRRSRQDPKTKPVTNRLDEILKLASEGYRASQIGEQFGVREQYIRDIARRNGIKLPDETMGNTRQPDAARIIRETVNALEGLTLGIQLLNGGISTVNKSAAEEWATSLSKSIRSLNRLHKQLKEVANV